MELNTVALSNSEHVMQCQQNAFSFTSSLTLCLMKTTRMSAEQLWKMYGWPLKEPLRLLKVMCCWPRDRGPNLRFIGRTMQAPSFFVLLGEFLFLIMGTKNDIILVIQAWSDFICVSVFTFKGLALFNSGERIARIFDMVQNDFTDFENVVPETKLHLHDHYRKLGARLVHLFMAIYALHISNCAILAIVSLVWDAPEDRHLPLYVWPSDCFRQIEVFFPAVIVYLLHLYPSYGAAAFDVLFICLAIELRCKAEILQAILRTTSSTDSDHSSSTNVLSSNKNDPESSDYVACVSDRDLEGWKGDRLEEEKAYKRVLLCVKYYKLINELRNELEIICAPTLLSNLLFILCCFGIPALRLLYSVMSWPRMLFMWTYALWTLSQLLLFCWCGDALARESENVALAAYHTFRPSRYSRRMHIALNILTTRAQKPLYLSAANFVKLNFVMYLELMRRSYSFYAALFRLA